MQDPISEEEIYRFIFERIDSVPHLEALLLLWNGRPKRWGAEELSARLFVSVEGLRAIVDSLASHQLADMETIDGRESYYYRAASSETDGLVEAVDATYRRELVRVSRAIHSKASSGAREFGRAFKFNKGKD